MNFPIEFNANVDELGRFLKLKIKLKCVYSQSIKKYFLC